MPAAAPSAAELKKLLGPAHRAYLGIIKLTESLSVEWKDYGPKHGRQCKVTQKGKALLYLVPQAGSLRVNFGVRESERAAVLALPIPEEWKESLRTAKKYAEGYPLRVTVSGAGELKGVGEVIAAILGLRG